MDDLEAISAIWENWYFKISPTMVDYLEAISAIWENLIFQNFSNHGG